MAKRGEHGIDGAAANGPHLVAVDAINKAGTAVTDTNQVVALAGERTGHVLIRGGGRGAVYLVLGDDGVLYGRGARIYVDTAAAGAPHGARGPGPAGGCA